MIPKDPKGNRKIDPERILRTGEKFVAAVFFLLLLAASACFAVWLLCLVYEHMGAAVTLASAALFVVIGWVFGFIHGRLLRLSETWKPTKRRLHNPNVFPFDRQKYVYSKRIVNASDEVPF